MKTALQKTSSLSCLPNFTSEGYFVIKDLVTETATYPYAITNIEQSVLIGLKKEENVRLETVNKNIQCKIDSEINKSSRFIKV